MTMPNPFLAHIQQREKHEQHAEQIKLAWITFCEKLESIKRKAEDHKKNV